LNTLPAYADFVKSPQYDEWLKASAALPRQASSK
jgi:hypothetical protein